MTNPIEEKIKSLGHTLPEMAIPVAKCLPYLKHGNQLVISGQIAKDENNVPMVGKLGDDYSVDQGVTAAQRSALYIIAIIKHACDGDFSKCKKIIKLNGFVNSTPDFTDQPTVINGASELLVDLFGEDVGMHARSAVGTYALPRGVAVEISAEVEIDPS